MSIYQPKISSLKQLSSGKVRDIYSIDKDKILIVTTDRISAFDSSMPTPIPDKGIILNKISEFWMKKVESVLPNHLTGESPEDYVKKNEINEVKDRATVAKKMSPVPVEAVVRGFITGSAWEEYQQTGFVCGLKLPSGLNKGDKLPRPIFTPARKAISGKHDMNITFSQSEQEFGENLMKEIRSKSIALFEIGFDYLKERNIKLLDTKFEFGLDSKKELVLIDEVLTPDSSRYMFNNLNMDKQFLRDYLREINWDTKDSMPNLPKKVVLNLSERYRFMLSSITGQQRPVISVLMGSESDWDVMSHSVKILDEFDISFEFKVLSAHRMPDELYSYADDALFRGIKGIIAGAGGAAHLPGMLASKTIIPIFGVPIPTEHLKGEDSLYSIVQMPKGIPVATFAIGKAGAINAALHIVSILSLSDEALMQKLDIYRAKQTELAKSMNIGLDKH